MSKTSIVERLSHSPLRCQQNSLMEPKKKIIEEAKQTHHARRKKGLIPIGGKEDSVAGLLNRSAKYGHVKIDNLMQSQANVSEVAQPGNWQSATDLELAEMSQRYVSILSVLQKEQSEIAEDKRAMIVSGIPSNFGDEVQEGFGDLEELKGGDKVPATSIMLSGSERPSPRHEIGFLRVDEKKA